MVQGTDYLPTSFPILSPGSAVLVRLRHHACPLDLGYNTPGGSPPAPRHRHLQQLDVQDGEVGGCAVGTRGRQSDVTPAKGEEVQGVPSQREVGEPAQAVLVPGVNAHHGHAQVLCPQHRPACRVHS